MGCVGGSKKDNKKQPSVRISKSVEEKQREKLYEIKIVLLGDPAVGKSSLVQRFCQDKFEENYKLTIGGAYLQKEVKGRFVENDSRRRKSEARTEKQFQLGGYGGCCGIRQCRGRQGGHWRKQ